MPYFDHCASTPLDPRVLREMTFWLTEFSGNPSSSHRYGRAAQAAINVAREQVAKLVDASSEQVIFTPSGTIANNLAILGYLNQDPARGLWLSGVEHSSIQSIAQAYSPSSMVHWLETDEEGIVQLDSDRMQRSKRNDLLAVMYANNETGVIEPVQTLRSSTKKWGLRFHCDAVQAAGKIPISFRLLEIDSMTIAAHKMNGPVGVGALIVRNSADLNPIYFGGGQEKGLCSGTENTAAIVGFGMACQLALAEMEAREKRVRRLQQELESRLVNELDATIYAARSPRVPGVTMFALPHIHGELLVMRCDQEGFALSSGSACHSSINRASPVLRSMGVDEELALGAVRASLGKDNTQPEVDEFIRTLRKIIDQLMVESGVR